MKQENWQKNGRIQTMKARIICMASAKGGSGKTSIVASFGAFLAAIGKKVLLIDTDAATNGLSFLYLKEILAFNQKCKSESSEAKGVYDFEENCEDIKVVALPTKADLLPATFNFKNTENVSSTQYEKSLKSIVTKMATEYDYIFLDAQAGSDIFAQIAMNSKISDEVVIVSEYDPMSAAGIERLKGLMRDELTYIRTSILLNKMLPDFVKSFNDFMEIAKYLSPIPWSKDVVLAYARRNLALDVEKGNEFTLSIMQTLKGLLGEEISQDIKKWSKEKESIVREPLETQYQDAEKELQVLYREKKFLSRKNIFRRQREKLTFVFVLITIPVFLFFSPITGNFLSFLGDYKATVSAIIAASTAIIAYLTSSYFNSVKISEYDVVEDRLYRRISVLHDRLRVLETLRDADLETLIKTKL